MRERAARAIRDAGIALRPGEEEGIDVADFGLSAFENEGASMLTLVDTERIAVKLIVLLPEQTLPEHWHTAVDGKPGKEETVRVARGELRLYVPGPDSVGRGFVPSEKEPYYTSRRECVLAPGDQRTIREGTKHWLQAGKEGAVVFSFSSYAHDARDPFTDPKVVRVTLLSADE